MQSKTTGLFSTDYEATKEYSSQLLFVVWKFWAFILEDRLSGKRFEGGFMDNKQRWRDGEMRFIMEREFIENRTDNLNEVFRVQVNLNEVFQMSTS